MTAEQTQQARPDAVYMPEGRKRGKTHHERVMSILAIVEPMLGVDYDGGERAYVRRQVGGRLFATRDPTDTLFFSKDHPSLAQKPRYRWDDRGEGVFYGYLINDQ
jgi:hypothetical protein